MSLSHQETFALLQATRAETPQFFFVKSAGAAGVNVPFSPPIIDELVAAMWQYQPIKDFFFEWSKKPDDLDIFGIIETIVTLGPKVVARIISLATPWPNDEAFIELVTKWSASDRLKFLLNVKRGSDWQDFSEALSELMKADSKNRTTDAGIQPVAAEGLTQQALSQAVLHASSPPKPAPKHPSHESGPVDAVPQQQPLQLHVPPQPNAPSLVA
jgi:AcrR family transcriptional regulator